MPAARQRTALTMACLAAVAAAAAEPALLQVRVLAGDHDRLDTPVSAVLPAIADDVTTVVLTEDGSGHSFPGQIEHRDGQAWLAFILAGPARAGQERLFSVTAGTAAPRVTVRASDAVVEVLQGDRPMLCYRRTAVAPPAGQSPLLARNAYLHPVWTPAGHVVTGDFVADHPHQRGVFLAWTKTLYEGRHPDFWNLAQGLGRVRGLECSDVVSGPVWGGFRATHVSEDLKAPGGPAVVLNETWELKAWAVGGPEAGWWFWDLRIRQRVAGTSPLALPKYIYGGMAFRGSERWSNQPWEFLSSAGRTRADADGTCGSWGDLTGPLGDAWAGLTMLGHPANLRFPQPFRCHPTVPYFCMAPSQQGPWSIEPGKPLELCYRFVVHDGKADAALAERLFRDFAQPPQVVVESPR